jgi:hypothetical protein
MPYSSAADVWNSERLIEGYSAMANDAQREREAEEWSEALIGDAFAGA